MSTTEGSKWERKKLTEMKIHKVKKKANTQFPIVLCSLLSALHTEWKSIKQTTLSELISISLTHISPDTITLFKRVNL